MKNKIITVFIIAIIIILDIIFIFSKDNKFSDLENRYLTSFPRLEVTNILNGKYMNNLESYLKDQFPLRNKFMGLKTTIEKITLKKEINNVYLSKNNYLIEKYNTINDKDKLIKIFNDFNNNININLKLLLVPTSISVNEEELPLFSIYDSELNDIEYIRNQINFDSINVYDTLKYHNQFEDMYYHTDHHWTTDGAYYAYQKIANNFNLEYLTKDNFNIKKVSDKFYGTLYSKTNDYHRNSDEIYIYEKDNDLDIYYADTDKHTMSLYEYSYLDKKDKYAMFLDNNHSIIIITNNEINNSNELIIIKDSYANSLVPFLVNHYHKVHIIDPRYYHQKISEYISNNPNVVDGIIIYNIGTIEKDLGVYTIK